METYVVREWKQSTQRQEAPPCVKHPALHLPRGDLAWDPSVKPEFQPPAQHHPMAVSPEGSLWERGVLVFQGCRDKVPQIGWLEQQKFIFSESWRLEVCRCQQGWILTRPLSLASRRHLLPVSSYGPPCLHVCVFISSSCKDTSQIRLAPTLMASFTLITS